jgi:hypothetical protein
VRWANGSLATGSPYVILRDREPSTMVFYRDMIDTF